MTDGGAHRLPGSTTLLRMIGDKIMYFSFVIGMTWQVSDIQVKSKSMRKIVILHSLVSFIFNVTLLALAINIVASEI